MSNGTHTRSPVAVTLEELRDGNVPLARLEEAFGPDSLGILVVKGLDERFVELRSKVLSYASYLATLPDHELKKLECPEAKYLVGWSLGKEKLKSNKPDTLKGSYYVNCAFYQDPSLQNAPEKHPSTEKSFPDFPEYTHPNIWPSPETLPGFEAAVTALCTLIIDAAVLVARGCDRFAEKNVPDYPPGYLEHVVRTSMTTKARLLHYFPSAASAKPSDEDIDSWCATHLDHSCLTGLTSAMFTDESRPLPCVPASDSVSTSVSTTTPSASQPLPAVPELPTSPDPAAGLYIHTRDGSLTHVAIPRDALAFQTGEALQVITGGRFRAVPHFVRGVGRDVDVDADVDVDVDVDVDGADDSATPSQGRIPGGGNSQSHGSRGPGRRRIARNTLAVFTQPNLWEAVEREARVDFAGFARRVVARHY